MNFHCISLQSLYPSTHQPLLAPAAPLHHYPLFIIPDSLPILLSPQSLLSPFMPSHHGCTSILYLNQSAIFPLYQALTHFLLTGFFIHSILLVFSPLTTFVLHQSFQHFHLNFGLFHFPKLRFLSIHSLFSTPPPVPPFIYPPACLSILFFSTVRALYCLPL